jgi:regulator of protease activity HflC (stomatin/prohibitin superfamily)
MRSTSFFSVIIFVIIAGIGIALAYALKGTTGDAMGIVVGAGSFVIASLVSSSIKIADPWDKAVVLRLGKFQSLRGPGLFFIIPILDTIPYWIDTRVTTTSFKAEKTLTKDTVPVDVDAVLFGKYLTHKRQHWK